MKINISDILRNEKACVDIEFNDKVEGLHDRIGHDAIDYDAINSYTLSDNVVFNGTLRRTKGTLLNLSGIIMFEYDVNCYRCLKNVRRKMKIKVNENIFNAARVTDEDDVFTYEGEYLDIDIILKNYIILSLPMKQLCSDECKGLCPICGNNLNERECGCKKKKNINPQMEVLKKLL